MRDAIEVEARIAASVDAVWRLLTEQRGRWWPDMRFAAAVGAPLVETWEEDGRVLSATGEVTRCEPPVLLAFRWSEAGWARPLDVEIRRGFRRGVAAQAARG